MLYDTHIHSDLSADSDMTAEQIIEYVRHHHTGVVITDHMDLGYPENPCDFRLDIPAYFETYGHLRNEAFPELRILLGIEIGLMREYNEQNRNIAVSYPFDFIIGSIHNVAGKELGYGYELPHGEPGRAYEEYFRTVYDMVCENSFFDSLGHIDYPFRYYSEEMTCGAYGDWLDAIFKKLLERGQVIECNMKKNGDERLAGFRKEIFSRYKVCGGQYVTVGSDAHEQSKINAGFQEAFAMLDALGLQAVYFIERKMVPMAIH